MAFPKGNQYYLLRNFDGRNRIYEDKDLPKFTNKCFDYFKEVDANPIITHDYKGKDAEKVEYEHQRPYTRMGLCIFLGISHDTLDRYKKDRPDFCEVITHVEEIIRTQKFEGAAAGIFQHHIIARDLGLVDKVDNTVNLKSFQVGYSKDEDEKGGD